ncbi:hypothetical protein GCM10011502_19820 [Oceanisphaera marina]|uniref:Uncharacterized protein n=1 Tax=Oceanisphaera marina TaxID=2017550 RepID=A0ABQ1ILI6_9GAMM|nr:hypothetical protein [Oceanisphaera marina]GGB46461.1 hypothetical protein GCM10011502_19820 [Oceanisphaera marina]
MTDMLSARLFAPLALTAITALGLLLWILRNGDLCPGQRRRISDGLLSVWAVFGLALMLSVEAAVPSLMLWLGGSTLASGLGATLYQARLAGKRSLPLSWHMLALVLALCYGLGLLLREGPAALLMAGAGGCVFTHLIMVRAKHRLQAFNLLLPLVGIAFAVGWMVLLLVQTLWLQYESEVVFDTAHLIRPFVQMCAAVLLGAVIWLLPLLRKEQTRPPVIAVAALLILGALTVGQSIIGQLSINIG